MRRLNASEPERLLALMGGVALQAAITCYSLYRMIESVVWTGPHMALVWCAITFQSAYITLGLYDTAAELWNWRHVRARLRQGAD